MIRLILVIIIVALVVRAFIIAGSLIEQEKKNADPESGNGKSRKGVPKNLGEYVDYEDVGRKG